MSRRWTVCVRIIFLLLPLQLLHQSANAVSKDPNSLSTSKFSKTLELWNIELAQRTRRQPRFWNLTHLSSALSVTNYHQMAPFFTKLYSGQPVSVLALGSSITKDNGGCFHRSRDQILRGGCKQLSLAYMSKCKGLSRTGWAYSFMRTLNASWPHKDHVLYNLGVPGTSFYHLAHSVCLEQMLPSHVDLLLMEHLTYLEPPLHNASSAGAAEKLMQRVIMHLHSSTSTTKGEDKESAIITSRQADTNSSQQDKTCSDKTNTTFAQSIAALSATLLREASATTAREGTTAHAPQLPVVLLNMHRVLDFGQQDLINMERCITNITLCYTLCPTSFNHLPRISKLLQSTALTSVKPHEHHLAAGTGIRRASSLMQFTSFFIPHLWGPVHAYPQGSMEDGIAKTWRKPLVGGAEESEDGGDWQWAETVELSTDAVARHHGLASLSYTKLLHSIMQQDAMALKHPHLISSHTSTSQNLRPEGADQSLSINRCLRFSTLFKDSVHPMPPGELLLADLIMLYMSRSEEQYLQVINKTSMTIAPPVPHLDLSPAGRSDDQNGTAHYGRHQAPPMITGSTVLPLMSCYGTPQHSQGYGPANWTCGLGGGDEDVNTAMNTTRQHGWEFIETENGKFRPGWLSTVPGSTLWISVPWGFGSRSSSKKESGSSNRLHAKKEDRVSMFSSFSSGGHRYSRVGDYQIEVTYLASYKLMGQAELSCVSGCSCVVSSLDGHITERKHSIPKVHRFSVASTLIPDTGTMNDHDVGDCIVQVLVLNGTRSGSHKFKVSQISFKTWIDISLPLQTRA
ncbi:hypothetical protein CEUSTIGMA_g4560.t1 [Chlamydomonas eustigma]|uniref:Membrane-associated protein n=1 Tax=Chlamydomonas eustigma TaxID=1157962 RepID=A0A250X1Y8_9CHLO|nr:hypothetical protein CEUSTIGMA_g4560.t1 [Chlamydomonas eustigma]|eukprot:GAX77114.1 hypothetical protein CEUSTIGMA_g4560.t1 [Chlamydomonas eustigma]